MDRTRNPGHRYRRVWLAVTVTVVGLGWVGALMTRPAPVVFWTYLVTGTMAGLGAVMYQLGDGHTVPAASVVARRVVVFGAVFAAVFVTLIGYVAMLGGWALVVLMPLPLTSPALRAALSRHFDVAVSRPEPSAAEPPGEPTPSSTRVEPPRQACTMATQDLCHAWRASYVRLQRARSETVRARIVAARQTYLDELARRNPDGFEAWLRAGARAASDPARFLGDTPSGDTPSGDTPSGDDPGGDTPGDDPGPGTVRGNDST